MSREDYITLETEPLMIIEDKKQLKAYNDPKYILILDLLRRGPLSIGEIAFLYNQQIDKAKSEITIYNYLKTLQDVGLVIETGQRLVRGSTATTKLYARKAHLMFPMTLVTEKYWGTEEGAEIIEATRNLMSFHTNQPPTTGKDLQILLRKIYSIPTMKLKDYVNNYGDSLRTIFSECTQEEVREVIDLFSAVMILLESDRYEKELKKCFS